MLVPGVGRRTLRIPRPIPPFFLAVVAITLTLGGWALFAPSNAGQDILSPGPDASAVRSIAYTLPGAQYDDIVVRPASGGAGRVIASFPSSAATGFHARGAAAPLGDRLAVLWIPPFATQANLSIVDVASGETRQVETTFSSLSRLAWSSDGTHMAGTALVSDADGERAAVIEVDAKTLVALPVAAFENAIDVTAVGYSYDGTRLFIVVVDPKGSNLYAQYRGTLELVAELSPGRTRDWALSPDGARLAFVDVLSTGSRTHVGRTLTIATGAITTLPAEKNQVGASWMPGSPLPAFGGPGGEWQLTDPSPDAAYLVPERWSPDGSYLVATVYSAPSDRASRPTTALELITRATTTSESTRTRISDAAGAEFLGWVRDLN